MFLNCLLSKIFSHLLFSNASTSLNYGRINLEGHRHRVRRYAHGLRNLIRIGQGDFSCAWLAFFMFLIWYVIQKTSLLPFHLAQKGNLNSSEKTIVWTYISKILCLLKKYLHDVANILLEILFQTSFYVILFCQQYLCVKWVGALISLISFVALLPSFLAITVTFSVWHCGFLSYY